MSQFEFWGSASHSLPPNNKIIFSLSMSLRMENKKISFLDGYCLIRSAKP